LAHHLDVMQGTAAQYGRVQRAPGHVVLDVVFDQIGIEFLLNLGFGVVIGAKPRGRGSCSDHSKSANGECELLCCSHFFSLRFVKRRQTASDSFQPDTELKIRYRWKEIVTGFVLCCSVAFSLM